jgi:hypothetical protein
MNKQFAERVNRELDEIGVPPRNDERVEIFAKLLKLPRFKAEALLSGNLPLDDKILHLLAREFEVSAEWLAGRSNDRRN